MTNFQTCPMRFMSDDYDTIFKNLMKLVISLYSNFHSPSVIPHDFLCHDALIIASTHFSTIVCMYAKKTPNR